jgi:cytidylate kinase
VDSTDLARRRFVKTKFGTDIDDPHTYDLVVNTDLMPPETVAAVVMEGFKQRRMARSVRS